MSQSLYCKCPNGCNIIVLKRNYRCSAFDGYRRKWSPYSTIQCVGCGMVGRSKAKYVDRAPDAPEGWVSMTVQQLRAWKDKWLKTDGEV